MKSKKLIAAFVFPERMDWFLSLLHDKFGIGKDKVFCFKVLNDESKYLVTFKIDLKNINISLKDIFPQAITIHKNGSTFYTINALNKLIDDLIGPSDVDKKTVRINWSDYKNSIILIKNKDLSILQLERIF